jgi:hypothetical protein
MVGLGRPTDTQIKCAASCLRGGRIFYGRDKMSVPFKANVGDADLTAGNDSPAHLLGKLKEKDEAYRLLVDAHGRLLQARANRYARLETRLHTKLRLMEEERTSARASVAQLEDELSEVRSDLMEAEIGSKRTAGEVADLRKQLALADARINGLLSSRSWKLTAPLRGGTLSFVAFRAIVRRLGQRCLQFVKVVVPRLHSLRKPAAMPRDSSSVVERFEDGAGQGPPSGDRRE